MQKKVHWKFDEKPYVIQYAYQLCILDIYLINLDISDSLNNSSLPIARYVLTNNQLYIAKLIDLYILC